MKFADILNIKHLIRRLQNFYLWRKADIYKLWYGMHCIKPLQASFMYIAYILVGMLMSFLKPPKRVSRQLERIFNEGIKAFANKRICIVHYEVMKGVKVGFIIKDLDALEIVSPFFERSHINKLYHLIDKQFKGKAIFIDVGANIGKYAVILSKLFPQLEVIAVEPVEMNLKLLNYNLKLNNVHNVTVVDKALYSYEGRARLIISSFSGRHKVASSCVGYCEEVEVTTLDSVVTAYLKDYSKPIIIKVDVEGVEEDVVQGASFTLSKHRPVLLIEVNNREVLLTITKYGYRCVWIRDSPTNSLTNYVLCIPSEGLRR